MATNDELKKGSQLLKDQVTEVGFLDNAFKTLSATISSALDAAIDDMQGLDDVTQKVAKSYQRDITSSINKATKGLEDQVDLTIKIQKGQNVGKELTSKIERNEARRQLTLKKISNLEGVSNKDKRKLLGTANDVFKAEEAALKALLEQNEAAQKNKSLLQIAKENAGGLADKIDKSGTLSKVLSGGIKSVLTPARLLELAVLGVFNAMVSIDKLNGQLAKGLNMSYKNAAALSSELSMAANMSGELKLTAAGLGEALLAVNDITGVYTTENSKNLETLQLIHKASGLTYEQMGGIYSVTQATGGDLKKNTKEVLAQSALTANSFKVQINSKKVLADIGKISKATTLSLGGSAAELSKALTTSQALGIEMGQMESIADGLLNFEQSIANEMEAEMLTGKSLNLEKARQLALDNDIAGAAAEIAKQVGTAAEFGAMNRIQQEALAKATGLSREELANSLFVQEQLANSVGKEYDDKKKIIDELQAKGLSQDQIKAKLGKESLADLKAQSSVQENLNKSVAKLKEGFVSIAAPLMQIVSPIIDLLIPAVEMLSYLFVPIQATLGGIASTIGYITESVMGLIGIFTGANEQLSIMQTIVGSIAVGYGAIIAIQKIKAGYDAVALIMEKRKQKLGKANLLTSIADMAMTAFSSVAKIPFIGPALGIAAALAATALGYQYYNKADDMMSPGGNSGYGSRTLTGPEGAIALNNKDTVIAGTNLFPKEGKQSQQSPSVQISMARLEELQASTNAILDNILSKQGTVTMDSTEVGTSFAMNSYQVQ
ncbi:hypothetical protein OAO15_00680 [bacterium]|nr:hypothetical protein [bacterium]